ncbi:alpha/beta-hydrolase family protein [Corynebacterium uberis]|uniref:alpha/beta-hydrolase family protein n=1 Tax=Corynebacterium TaxID=1716 RepID=UPI001D0A524C|nr:MULTISPECIES: alpha/beta-hydrolase family protein [Corynebacterium]MCZ9308801.1 alpha/beta hydrolase [Corynebacterium sp. c6VSa_13]UDL72671.1 alpha/beta hydrolase [Corynebacterium uberis]UDL76453.1 alpha/beta hydrolase [Corynebacterium uberis]UDL78665.1 alpha/beta hydrolase [Corynebacterium uberis]UDL80944.1 alpha/beta hydrolase [Corynebacterium uberis]
MKRLHPWGIVGAGIMFVLGLTPSLLPREVFYQGVVCGLGAGIGYLVALGVHRAWQRWGAPWVLPRLARWVARWSARRSEEARRSVEAPRSVGWWRQSSSGGTGGAVAVSPRMVRAGEILLSVIVVCGVLVAVGFALRWQRAIAELTGSQAYTVWEFLLVIPVGFAVFGLMVAVGRLLRASAHWISRVLPARVRPTVRSATGWMTVVVACVVLVNDVIPGAIVGLGERAFSATTPDASGSYGATEEGVDQPQESTRSGSPASPVSADGLGTFGRRFVAGGLRRADLAALTGREAREPARVYAGLGSAPDNASRAQVLISELERTGAADREAILLVMPTGTGWVNLRAAQAFELLYGGNTAIASAQYSSLPSAFHFFAGGDAVRAAGVELLTPLIDWWNALPQQHRPKLYLYGESLGSTAVESAFSGIRDIAASVDGILLTGPPHFNPLHSSLVARRDPGSRAVSPEYSGGMTVRFAQDRNDIRNLTASPDIGSPHTRVLYVQHASDPVVWWSPRLLVREPDWLREPAGTDRYPGMHWIPVITFLQVSADLPVSQNVPQGHGHNYGDTMVDGFAAIAGVSAQSQPLIDALAEALPRALAMSGDERFG